MNNSCRSRPINLYKINNSSESKPYKFMYIGFLLCLNYEKYYIMVILYVLIISDKT